MSHAPPGALGSSPSRGLGHLDQFVGREWSTRQLGSVVFDEVCRRPSPGNAARADLQVGAAPGAPGVKGPRLCSRHGPLLLQIARAGGVPKLGCSAHS